MSFTRDARFTASHRDFEYDSEGHVKNLRALESFLETPRDWSRLLVKTDLPAVSEMVSGSDAIVNVGGTLYHLVAGVWVPIQDDANSYTNAEIDALVAGSSFAGAKVVTTTFQSLPHGSTDILAFGGEVFDSDGFHDNAVNNSRLTIPAGKAGKYLLSGNIEFATNATGYRALQLRKSGALQNDGVIYPAASGVPTVVGFAFLVSAAAGDYFQMTATQNSGGALNVGGFSSQFSASYQGA